MCRICANCSAERDLDDRRCRRCGHEQFVRVADADSAPGRREERVALAYRCRVCGRLYARYRPPCSECGSLTFEAIPRARTGSASTDERTTDPRQSPHPTLRTAVLSYAYAAALAVLSVEHVGDGALAAPFFLVGAVVAAPVTRTWVASALGVEFSDGSVLLFSLGAPLVALLVLVVVY